MAGAIPLARLTFFLFVFLTAVGAAFAGQNWIVGGPYGRLAWPRNLMVAFTQWWSWAALAPAMIIFSTRYPLFDKSRPRRIIAYVIACVAILLVHVALVTWIERATDRVTPGEDLKLTASKLFTKRLGINLLSVGALVLLGQAVAYHARLHRALDAAGKPQDEPGKRQLQKSPSRGQARLAVSNGSRTLMIDTGDVIWVEAAGNYCVIHARMARHIARSTLSELQEALGDGFVRASRSALVSTNEITAITDRTSQGDAMLVLRSGQQVRLTRTFRRAVLERLPPRL